MSDMNIEVALRMSSIIIRLRNVVKPLGEQEYEEAVVLDTAQTVMKQMLKRCEKNEPLFSMFVKKEWIEKIEFREAKKFLMMLEPNLDKKLKDI